MIEGPRTGLGHVNANYSYTRYEMLSCGSSSYPGINCEEGAICQNWVTTSTSLHCSLFIEAEIVCRNITTLGTYARFFNVILDNVAIVICAGIWTKEATDLKRRWNLQRLHFGPARLKTMFTNKWVYEKRCHRLRF